MSRKKIIKIIGAGIDATVHMTCQAVNELKKVDEIFVLGTDISKFNELVSTKVTYIDNLYANNKLDVANYDIIKDTILFALNKSNAVALVVPGHPRFAVSLTKILEKEINPSSDIKVEVFPGISSFDTMINDLKLDPLERGVAILDVNRLLLLNFLIEPRVNYFFYHICSIGNSKTNYENPLDNNHLLVLKKKLLEYYPENHNIIMMTSDNGYFDFVLKTRKLIEFENLLSEVTFSSSLYIPAIELKEKDINRNFFKILQDSLLRPSQKEG